MSARRRVVAVILDGLRRDFVTPELMPVLTALRQRGSWFDAHRSVFPSCTRVVSSSFATGFLPARHGLAGNTICLLDQGRLTLHDVGKPEFVDNKRRLTGHVLAKPTLAQRLADGGGVIVFNNVSPGAAYMHDPDGYGFVYHRAGSFGPGRVPIEGEGALDVTGDVAGDRKATERFAAEVVLERRPDFALLWTAEPDTSQHALALGSPAHHRILAEADRHVGLVLQSVEQARAAGEDVLFLVGSDHGHETVSEVVDIGAELVAAGLKADADSDDVMVAPNGTGALVYVGLEHGERIPRIDRFLRAQTWAGRVFAADELESGAGLPSGGGLAFAVAMASDEGLNAHGVPGRSLAAKPVAGKGDRIGFGQHGGLGRFEQSPVLIVEGTGFEAGRKVGAASSAVDIAPTVLRFLGRQADGFDGRPLQDV